MDQHLFIQSINAEGTNINFQNVWANVPAFIHLTACKH